MAEQPALFELPPPSVAPAPHSAELRALGEQLPPLLRLGTMSWSFPGWRGLVYDPGADPKLLAEAGLGAYTAHPILRTVEIDRSFYEPLAARVFKSLAEQVPDDFRFVVKAHELVTLPRFPRHARYGKRQGEPNELYLHAGYAAERVVAEAVAGLGPKLGVLLWQFPPQEAGDPAAFAEQLHGFLSRLPQPVPYAVELRNPELFSPAYGAALAQAGALHAHNVWGRMPSVLAQARALPPSTRRPLLVRWLMRRGDDYEGARSRFLPFARLAEPDYTSRTDVATLVAKALQHEVPALVLINNKAEGCAPESAAELGRAIAGKLWQRG